MFGITGLVGPTLVGALFDNTGSYLAGFLVVGGLGLLGAATLPLVHRLRPEDGESAPSPESQNTNIQMTALTGRNADAE